MLFMARKRYESLACHPELINGMAITINGGLVGHYPFQIQLACVVRLAHCAH